LRGGEAVVEGREGQGPPAAGPRQREPRGARQRGGDRPRREGGGPRREDGGRAGGQHADGRLDAHREGRCGVPRLGPRRERGVLHGAGEGVHAERVDAAFAGEERRGEARGERQRHGHEVRLHHGERARAVGGQHQERGVDAKLPRRLRGARRRGRRLVAGGGRRGAFRHGGVVLRRPLHRGRGALGGGVLPRWRGRGGGRGGVLLGRRRRRVGALLLRLGGRLEDVDDVDDVVEGGGEGDRPPRDHGGLARGGGRDGHVGGVHDEGHEGGGDAYVRHGDGRVGREVPRRVAPAAVDLRDEGGGRLGRSPGDPPDEGGPQEGQHEQGATQGHGRRSPPLTGSSAW